jgi:hypothetical protein
MAKRNAFLKRPIRILLILLTTTCLLISAAAQHGGGGGHSGGGHSGGGHSGGHSGGGYSGGHSGGGHSGGSYVGSGRSAGKHASGQSKNGGHFGWLHFGSRNRSPARAERPETPGILENSPYSLLVKNPGAIRTGPTPLIKPVLPVSAGFPLSLHSGPMGKRFSSQFHHHRALFPRRYGCLPASGCFFNGWRQVCFFEPALPLFYSSLSFGYFYSEFGTADDSLGKEADYSNSTAQPAINSSPVPSSMDNYGNSAQPSENSPSNSEASVGPPAETATKAPVNGFLIVLKNGTSYAVADYWLTQDYLEYVHFDGTRDHIPLEALDLEKTVAENNRRGRPFVLQSSPANALKP